MSRLEGLKAGVKAKITRYEKYAPAGFFVGGFLFDVITLDRIDNSFAMIQQGVFLVLIGLILSLMVFDEESPLQPPRWLNWAWNFRIEALHFLLGGLLSAFFLFFFRSSSLGASSLFLVLMSGLLVLNEFPFVQKQGIAIKFALFGVCLVSYFSYLVPILTGNLGFLPLSLGITAVGLCVLPLAWAYKKMGLNVLSIRKKILRPILLVMLTYLGLYYMKWIPPVPLSIQYMGIYHNVVKQPDGRYALYHERPWWKFWHNGDQTFRARPGDRIHAFVRVFSPTHFQDQVQLHWMMRHPQVGWQTMDRIPFRIVGGRDEGFRGHAFKSNFQPGDWRLQVETRDGHEIGRISFSVENATEPAEQSNVDYF